MRLGYEEGCHASVNSHTSEMSITFFVSIRYVSSRKSMRRNVAPFGDEKIREKLQDREKQTNIEIGTAIEENSSGI